MNQKADSEKSIVFQQLILDYGNELLRMSYLYLHDVQLAEDAVQETYLKVYKNWAAYRGDASVKTWITRIAINECINIRRKKWFQEILVWDSLELEASDNEYASDDQVIEAIHQLKPKLREVVIMFYYQEMKIKEIAVCLQIKESTVSVRLNRARAQLKTILESRYDSKNEKYVF